MAFLPASTATCSSEMPLSVAMRYIGRRRTHDHPQVAIQLFTHQPLALGLIQVQRPGGDTHQQGSTERQELLACIHVGLLKQTTLFG